MIPTLRGAVLPDFGQHLGYDGKAIDSHATGNKNGPGKHLIQMDWGKHDLATMAEDKDTIATGGRF